MLIFTGTEFTGLHMGTTLISIGMVDEQGHSFYAEFSDYDLEQVEPWMQENIIDKLEFNKEDKHIETKISEDFYSIKVKGTKDEIKKELIQWLDQYDDVIFVMDIGHYDFILLIDLITGDAARMSERMSGAYYDINHDISVYKGVNISAAYRINRESLYKEINETDLPYMDKSSTMYRAELTKGIYYGIHDID